ncbi:MAG: glycine hydroxymethyltransferase [Spirochaetales bacterium]|nr:MAG: glycine hydroxymethyltransferase [Spirochaetales bacterium]
MNHPVEKIHPGFLAYLANLTMVSTGSPEVARSIVQELEDQRNNLKLIASENYSSISSQVAMGNLMTDKYAEGYPHHRFYAGCGNIDDIESYAIKQACEVFGCEYAYVQPHSGADANLIAYWAILNTRVEMPYYASLGESNPSKLTEPQWQELRRLAGNQRLLGMDYYSGGHLTHGYRHNISAKMFDSYSYGVNRDTGLLDYDEIEAMAVKVKPLILLAGYSAYPRHINFARMRNIADKVGAVFMVDMAHFGGLVAGGVFQGEHNPIPYAHVVTSTTHKTLKGPRGGLILCVKEFEDSVNKGCPLVIGGPLPHMMAAKAVALREANTPDFKAYSRKIVENAAILAQTCMEEGLKVTTGGTDHHLFLIDVRPFGITGRQGESALRDCNITLNRNSLPFDPNGPWYTSGLRMGTPALTTLGMGTAEMKQIAKIIGLVLRSVKPENKPGDGPSKSLYTMDEKAGNEARARVHELLTAYPVYPEIDLAYLKKVFC